MYTPVTRYTPAVRRPPSKFPDRLRKLAVPLSIYFLFKRWSDGRSKRARKKEKDDAAHRAVHFANSAATHGATNGRERRKSIDMKFAAKQNGSVGGSNPGGGGGEQNGHSRERRKSIDMVGLANAVFLFSCSRLQSTT
jgi:hypothetical protein